MKKNNEIIEALVRYFSAFKIPIKKGLWFIKLPDGKTEARYGKSADIVADLYISGKLFGKDIENTPANAGDKSNATLKILKSGEPIALSGLLTVSKNGKGIKFPKQKSASFLKAITKPSGFLAVAQMLEIKDAEKIADTVFGKK